MTEEGGITYFIQFKVEFGYCVRRSGIFNLKIKDYISGPENYLLKVIMDIVLVLLSPLLDEGGVGADVGNRKAASHVGRHPVAAPLPGPSSTNRTDIDQSQRRGRTRTNQRPRKNFQH